MDPIARAAEDALLAHPHPAVRLGELTRMLAEPIDRRLTAARVRAVLEAHPERFRIIDPLHLRWPGIADETGAGADDAWVLSIVERRGPGCGSSTTTRLRDSIRWMGRGVDGRSGLEVARWTTVMHAHGAARASLERTAAPDGEGPV
ncbi:MAG: hypothetical protein AMS19_05890 [Gemmatimonas sp. SG8_23]|nr:MAG: hypothetical protein AMS19_05890 [Gemmatimonas sp. SG8_23]